ncbi:hypothetical protein PLESTM_001491400 [Pleodorina starrii]|nr:hypothetical protein PLESTM_001491400 [Pleodorina starrii]
MWVRSVEMRTLGTCFEPLPAGVRNAWRSGEAPTFESLAFGWLALARKHESLQCAPPAGSATGEELTDT